MAKDYRNGKGTHDITTPDGTKRTVKAENMDMTKNGKIVVETPTTEWICVSIKEI